MSRWRIAVIVTLILIPFVAFCVIGSYYLWISGLTMLVWWPLFLIMTAGYVLAWYWQKNRKLLPDVDFTPPLEWTERDKEAWKLIEARGKAAATLPVEKFMDVNFYLETAQEMALELARFYQPKAKDPIDNVTVPEILAVIEFAAHDLSLTVEQYLPAGNLLTVRNWKQAKKAIDWYPAFNAVYWAVSAVLSPIATAQRFLASQVGVSTPLKAMQDNMLAFFYTAYVERVGTYLVELHSGRLRVGASRYLELKKQHTRQKEAITATDAAEAAAEHVTQVAITIIGQVKAGKSSLINALLGERKALTDVLPLTAEVTRYELQLPDIPTRLVIFDTVGYGHAGPKADQVKATRDAVQKSDLVLHVLHARNPARQPDMQMLQALADWHKERPGLKKPPILGVLTHIDLLSPAMEWSPPYDWHHPNRPKEEQIAQALAAAKEQVAPHLADITAACTAEGKQFGVREELMPLIVRELDEAHAVALVRCIDAEANTGRARKVVKQLLALAMQAGQAALGAPIKS
jgi:uncharacterized protein